MRKSASIIALACLALALLSAIVHAAPAPAVTAVMPFKNTGADESLSWLGAGIQESIATDIMHIKAVEAVSPAALKPSDDLIKMTGDEMIEYAKSERIGLVWTGEYKTDKKGMRVDIAVIKASTGKKIAKAVVKAPMDKLQREISKAVLKIIANLGLGVSEKERKLVSAKKTSHVEAWKLNAEAARYKGVYASEADDEKKRAAFDHWQSLLAGAVAKDPKYAEAHKNAGWMYIDAQVWNKAAESMDAAYKLKPNLIDAALGKGIVYEKQFRFNDAIKMYKSAIAINPSVAINKVYLLNLQVRMKNTKEALDLSKKLIKSPILVVKVRAIDAMRKMADKSAVPSLAAAMRDDRPKVRMAAVGALGAIDDKLSITNIRLALRDEDKDVRYYAVLALGNLADPDALPDMIGMLKDPDNEVRGAAAYVLGNMGDKSAAPALKEMFNDPSREVGLVSSWALVRVEDEDGVKHLLEEYKKSDDKDRFEIIQTIGELQLPVTVPLLAAALSDQNPAVVNIALESLRKIGAKSVPDTLALLNSTDSLTRANAARALGVIGDKTAAESVRVLLNDPDYMVRLWAAWSLAVLADASGIDQLYESLLKETDKNIKNIASDGLYRLGAQAVTKLTDGLKSPDAESRKTVLKMLGAIGDKSSIPAIKPLLNDPDHDVKFEAAAALGKTGDTSGMEILYDSLLHYANRKAPAAIAMVNIGKEAVFPLSQAMASPNVETRRRAAEALAYIGTKDKSAVPALAQAIEDADMEVRLYAVGSLGMIDDPDVLPHLRKALSDSEKRIRLISAYALARKGEKDVMQVLIDALKDPNPEIRRDIAAGLGELKDKSVIPALKDALLDPDENVQKEIIGALKALGEQIP